VSNTDTVDASVSVAVIGMAGRFPGARNIGEFWHNISNGIESISFFSDEELLNSGVDPDLLKKPNYVKANSMLEDVEMFDASFFGYTPREAEVMDPQHRLFLECAWESLENAGYVPENYKGRIGVISGTGANSYLQNNLLPNREIEKSTGLFQILISNAGDFVPTRTSYKLNLKGPSMNVGTSCSTSLATVQIACQSLLTYQCDMALAGGVRILLPQKAGYLYQEGGVLSPDGHCRAFDADAGGTVSGNGVGVVVLKRLEDAIEDGDHMYAVIKGLALNNDGSSKVGYTAPSVEGQTEVITEALTMADVEAETISYVETHGTGTELGDPIEIKALSRAFRFSTQKKSFCAVGSVKTNIGHLDAASGIASFIKTVLALQNKVIPPSLYFKKPNPGIDFENSPFYVNATRSDWQTDGNPRRAGISSFGVGGTNVHLVLEEAPAVDPPKSNLFDRPYYLLSISARSEAALNKATANLVEYLQNNSGIYLPDLAYTLSIGRKAFNYRRVFVCKDIDGAVSALKSLDSQKVFTNSLKQNENVDVKDTSDEILNSLRDPQTSESETMLFLNKLGKLWLKGVEVDWVKLYAHKKHYRIPLPTYPFEHKYYWIDTPENTQTSEKSYKGKRQDIAEWFYIPSWKRSLHDYRKSSDRKCLWLVFVGECGFSHEFMKKIKEYDNRVICVAAGKEFNKTGEDSYALNAQRPEDYISLVTELKSAGRIPEKIVHVWSFFENGNRDLKFDEMQYSGFYSLLYLTQAFGTECSGSPLQIAVISNNVHEVSGEEELIPEKASLIGQIKVIPQEYSNISCCNIDVTFQESNMNQQTLINRIYEELAAEFSEPHIAFRGNYRWIPSYEPVRFEVETKQNLLKNEGIYLITGGLGNIGLLFAEYLARKYKAKLILIGRTVPDKNRMEKIKELERAGAEVLVLSVDIADGKKMKEVLLQTEKRFGRINGVIHAAGVTGEKAFRTIAETNYEECEEQFRPKVQGLIALSRILKGKGLDFCLLFSSLSAVLGGLGFVSYSAANIFMDAFAQKQNRSSNFPWISVNWDGWLFEEIEQAGPLGNHLLEFAITPDEGIDAFERVLSSGANHLVISTGDLSERIKQWTKIKSIHDIEQTQKKESSLHERPNLDTPYTGPRNEIEDKLVKIWQDLFAIEQIGIHDDFFELGGDSVMAAQSISRIKDNFDVDVHVGDIFEKPTIDELAESILSNTLKHLGDDDLHEIVTEMDEMSDGKTV